MLSSLGLDKAKNQLDTTECFTRTMIPNAVIKGFDMINSPFIAWPIGQTF